MANEQNLIPIRKGDLSNEELKKRQSNGGKKSVKARRKKRLMSQIYAEFLQKEHEINLAGSDETVKVYGDKLLEMTMLKVLAKGDSPGVSLMKEIREATEGNKVALTNPDGTDLFSKGIKVSFVDAPEPEQIIEDGEQNEPPISQEA